MRMIPPHKYKRQHLNVPDILALCLRLKRDARTDIPAASSYSEARLRPLLYGEAYDRVDKCRRRFRRRDILDLIGSGADIGSDKKLFGQIVDNLLWHDPYSLLANYRSCVDVGIR